MRGITNKTIKYQVFNSFHQFIIFSLLFKNREKKNNKILIHGKKQIFTSEITMNFKQTYRPGSMNVVMDSGKKSLATGVEIRSRTNVRQRNFFSLFLKKATVSHQFRTVGKRGRKPLAFGTGKSNRTKYRFCAKNRLYYNVIQSNTKKAQNV